MILKKSDPAPGIAEDRAFARPGGITQDRVEELRRDCSMNGCRKGPARPSPLIPDFHREFPRF